MDIHKMCKNGRCYYVFVYFVSAFSFLQPVQSRYSDASQTDTPGTTADIADIDRKLDNLANKYPDNLWYRHGIEVAREALVSEIRRLRLVLKYTEGKLKENEDKIREKEDKIREKDGELLKQNLPVQVSEEFDRFLLLHESRITLTRDEKTAISKINDTNRRRRTRLLKVCEHVITDLMSTEWLVEKLNEEIDLPEYENLNKLPKAKRVKNICSALIYLKFNRNAKVCEVFMNGPKVKKIVFFPYNDVWNEGLAAFMNGHKTAVDFQGIEYESS